MFFFSSRRRHTRLQGDWSSDVCSSDLDLGPLQQMNANVRDSNAFLFTLRPAYRFRNTVVPMSVDYDPTTGQNPAYGGGVRSGEGRGGGEGGSWGGAGCLKKKKKKKRGC